MYRLTKEFRFEAAHQLPDHDGKCARLHGHSWKGQIIVEGDALITSGPKAGMLIDYGDLSKAIAPIVEKYLDHYFLNQSTGLENPTSECLALWVYHALLKEDVRLEAFLKAVVIEETCTSRCEYRPTKPLGSPLTEL